MIYILMETPDHGEWWPVVCSKDKEALKEYAEVRLEGAEFEWILVEPLNMPPHEVYGNDSWDPFTRWWRRRSSMKHELEARVERINEISGRDYVLDFAYGKARLMRKKDVGEVEVSWRLPYKDLRSYLDGLLEGVDPR